jgi:hypothetical protein
MLGVRALTLPKGRHAAQMRWFSNWDPEAKRSKFSKILGKFGPFFYWRDGESDVGLDQL